MGSNASASKPVKEDYFELIRKTIISNARTNNNNALNYIICLEKKDFINNKISRKITKRSNQKYINWKKYLLFFLHKEAELRIIWAIDLHFWIINQEFINELLWLNDFFYQEYKIQTQPKCIREYEHINPFQNTSKSSTSIYNFKNNFMGSFLSTTFDSTSSKNPQNQYKHKKHKIKEYVKYFQQHIFDEKHPINLIIKQFVIEFNKNNSDVIQQIENDLTQEQKNKKLDEIIGQLQRFITEMQIVLKLFYSNTISYQYFNEEKDEFINLVTSLVFNNTQLYNQIYLLFSIVMKDEVNQMSNQLQKFKYLQPEELGIKAQFCLNESTRTFQESLRLTKSEHQKSNNQSNGDNDGDALIITSKEIINIQSKQNKPKQKGTIEYQPKCAMQDIFKEEGIEHINMELNIVSESEKVNVFKKAKKKQMLYNQFNEKIVSVPPFQSAIQLLKSLGSCKVPLEKMMIIATISAEITDAVNLFWKDVENNINKPSLLSIDSNQLMAIFIYIILKADIPELMVHSQFVEHFTTPMTKSTMMGYYFSTINGSLKYITKVKKKEDFLKSEMIEEEDG